MTFWLLAFMEANFKKNQNSKNSGSKYSEKSVQIKKDMRRVCKILGWNTLKCDLYKIDKLLVCEDELYYVLKSSDLSFCKALCLFARPSSHFNVSRPENLHTCTLPLSISVFFSEIFKM